MNTILYATDYSEKSVAALHYAYGLSKKLNAQLVAIHVFDMQINWASAVSLTYSRREVKAFAKDKEKLQAYCARHLGNDPDKLNISIKIVEDETIWEGILEKADETETDLIVVGTKGDSPLRKFFLGSTAAALIEKAYCPVLAIPLGTKYNELQLIVYASDFEGSDIFTIEDLVRLAEPFDAEIRLVHITDKDKKTAEDQLHWFKNMLRHKVVYKKTRFDLRYGEDIFAALQNYVNEIEPDMIVMLEREGHGLIKDLRHRDLVKRMKSEGHFPLLSFNKKNIGREQRRGQEFGEQKI
ncbi:universal stress protein [Maribacter sp. ACAM166]|uniref:universal stress protein n=1 Tax=Maribacter sp. ACAM166 TaxID=2508996 RepID=UPI0010FF439C|nr:universal stress protein [Maribacter sp. ACAM166]TLP81799.1 universal stress protein [Maribacter sp. ACAM166]